MAPKALLPEGLLLDFTSYWICHEQIRPYSQMAIPCFNLHPGWSWLWEESGQRLSPPELVLHFAPVCCLSNWLGKFAA